MRDLEHGSVLQPTLETILFVLEQRRDSEPFQQTSEFNTIDILMDKAKAARLFYTYPCMSPSL